MKKLIIMLAALIPALAATNKLNAQQNGNLAFQGMERAAFGNFATIDNSKNSGESIANINSKAVKNFSKNYKKVSSPRWEIIMDGYTAEFTENGVRNIVYYDTKGNWAGNLKRYPADKLPGEVQDILDTQYGRYTIDGVSQIETTASNGVPTYIAVAEDKKSIKWLRIFDGEVEEYKVFSKK